MTDSEIVSLLLARETAALREVQNKYGAYCAHIAANLLDNAQDAEECVNDAFFKLWNTVPPNEPTDLKAFLAKIVRTTSTDRLRVKNAKKRGGGRMDAVLSELEDCAKNSSSPEDDYTKKEMQKLINRFLSELPKRNREMFILRYFFAEDTAVIAEKFGIRETNVRQTLSRICGKLKKYLKKEGY